MQNNRILVFGNGYIANRIYNHFNNKFEIEISTADVTNCAQVQNIISIYRPTIVINAAAKTISDEVEKLENRSDAFDVNVKGAVNIAQICKENNIYMIHFSTGCVFDGDNNGLGFTEEDTPTPKCYYTLTKLFADDLLMLNFDVAILRIRLPASRVPHPRNFITKLLKFNTIVDANISITIVEDLMNILDVFMAKRITGLYNATNPGYVNVQDVAAIAQEKGLMKQSIKVLSVEEFNNISLSYNAVVRVNSVLDTRKIESIIALPHIKQAIKEHIDTYGASI